jgi:WD40 repeat protein
MATFRVAHVVPRTPSGALPALATFSHDSRVCALIVPPNLIQLVDSASGKPLVRLQTPERHLFTRLAFSPNDQFLAAGSLDHYVLLWDLFKLRAKLTELALDW